MDKEFSCMDDAPINNGWHASCFQWGDDDEDLEEEDEVFPEEETFVQTKTIILKPGNDTYSISNTIEK